MFGIFCRVSLVLVISFGTVLADYVEYDSPEQQYVSYRPGDLPLIISAPHGGYTTPSSIPNNRQNGCLVNGACVYRHGCGTTSSSCSAVTSRDSYTKEIAYGLWNSVYDVTGRRPHLIINELHRKKLDANREVELAAFGVPAAVQAYGNYTLFIQKAKTLISLSGDDRALFLDIHGQTHSENWVELGYAISGRNLDSGSFSAVTNSSIRALQQRTCSESDVTCYWRLISGDWSFGHFLELHKREELSDVRVVPSPGQPSPNGGGYYSGGYNTQTYGSRYCGNTDAIQIEMPRSIRFGERMDFVEDLTQAIVSFMCFHNYIQN